MLKCDEENTNTNNPIRVDDQYLIEVLKLTPGFIKRNSRAMGNRTRPRAYFLDTVLTYLRRLEMEVQRKYQDRLVDRDIRKEEILRDFEEVRRSVQARALLKKRKTA